MPGRPDAADRLRGEDGAPPRYVPERPLPTRGYLPGRRGERASQAVDAGGAAVGTVADVDAAVVGEVGEVGDVTDGEVGEVGDAWCAGWRSYTPYLWGVDLYNHGYGWEAHEAWEALWRAAPRGSPARLFLQGLIQCAAAQVQARAGRASGARRLAVRGTDKLERAARLAVRGTDELERAAERAAESAAGPRFLGVDAPTFAAALRAWTGGLLAGEAAADGWPWLVLA